MYENSNELYHHGVKGQKWGVRRFQNYDGTPILKKGTVVKRVSLTRDDPTYDNKKYVSINQEDHDKWDDYIGGAYVKKNKATFTQTYVTTKDLKVMSSAKQGELYTKMLMDSDFGKQAIRDTEYVNQEFGLKESNSAAENISRNIAMQTQTGKAFIENAMKNGYDALFDTHGTNVSKNPVIVLNPDSNLSRKADPVYTQAVQDFLKRYYGN